MTPLARRRLRTTTAPLISRTTKNLSFEIPKRINI